MDPGPSTQQQNHLLNSLLRQDGGTRKEQNAKRKEKRAQQKQRKSTPRQSNLVPRAPTNTTATVVRDFGLRKSVSLEDSKNDFIKKLKEATTHSEDSSSDDDDDSDDDISPPVKRALYQSKLSEVADASFYKYIHVFRWIFYLIFSPQLIAYASLHLTQEVASTTKGHQLLL